MVAPATPVHGVLPTVADWMASPAGRLPIGMVSAVVASDGPWLASLTVVVAVRPAGTVTGSMVIAPVLCGARTLTRSPPPLTSMVVPATAATGVLRARIAVEPGDQS